MDYAEQRYKENSEAFRDYFDRERDYINGLKNQISDLETKIAFETDPKKKENLQSKLKGKKEQLKITQLRNSKEYHAIDDLKTSIKDLKDQEHDLDEVKTRVEDAKKEFVISDANGEVKYDKDAKRLGDAFRKDEDEKIKEIRKDFDAASKEAEATFKSKINSPIQDRKSFGSAINGLEATGRRCSGYAKYDEKYHHEFTPYSETQKKLDDLEKYEQDVRNGVIERVTKEKKTIFHFKSGHKPTVAIVTGKEALLKMASAERKIKALDSAYIVAKEKGLKRTTETLLEIKAKVTKERTKAEEEFRNSDFEMLQKAVEEQRKKDAKERCMADYARLYALLLEVSPDDKEKYAELEGLLNEIVAKGLMDEYDIGLAQSEGKSIYHKKHLEQMEKESDRRAEKFKKETEAIKQKEYEEKLRAEIVKDMVSHGWHMPGGVAWKGSDIDFVEETKQFEAEVDRRLHEKLFPDRGPIHDEPEIINYEEAGITLNSDAFNMAVEGRTAEKDEWDRTISNVEVEKAYYRTTAGMTRQQRALESLKREGHIREDATLEDLNKVEREAVEIQMRQEAEISKAIEEFVAAKKAYDNAVQVKHDEKISGYSMEHSAESRDGGSR